MSTLLEKNLFLVLEKVVSGGASYSPRNLLVWFAAGLSQHSGLESNSRGVPVGTAQPIWGISDGALHLAIG